jgi:hypothetical protein
MEQENIIYILVFLFYVVSIFYFLVFRPKGLFRKGFNKDTIDSFSKLGLTLKQDKVSIEGIRLIFQGIYKKHTVRIDSSYLRGFKAFYRVSITYKVNSKLKDHKQVLKNLNKKLKEQGYKNSNSHWVADSLSLAWEIRLSKLNFQDFKTKLDEAIELVNQNNFSPLGSSDDETQFGIDWDKSESK